MVDEYFRASNWLDEGMRSLKCASLKLSEIVQQTLTATICKSLNLDLVVPTFKPILELLKRQLKKLEKCL